MLLDSTMQLQSNIIIVGNGSSLLEKENGHLIDQFDIVVRFNEYKIKGYEKYVGTKTTYWFNTVNFQNKQNESRMFVNYSKIFLHIWQWDINKDPLFKSFKQFYQDRIELIKTQESTIIEIQKFVNDFSYFNYSTGAIAIWMLLKEHPKVVITGFDWWIPNKKHHYSDNVPIGTTHKPDKEYNLISKLIEEGKVEML